MSFSGSAVGATGIVKVNYPIGTKHQQQRQQQRSAPTKAPSRMKGPGCYAQGVQRWRTHCVRARVEVRALPPRRERGRQAHRARVCMRFP